MAGTQVLLDMFDVSIRSLPGLAPCDSWLTVCVIAGGSAEIALRKFDTTGPVDVQRRWYGGAGAEDRGARSGFSSPPVDEL
jgi:hypothetical protein